MSAEGKGSRGRGHGWRGVPRVRAPRGHMAPGSRAWGKAGAGAGAPSCCWGLKGDWAVQTQTTSAVPWCCGGKGRALRGRLLQWSRPCPRRQDPAPSTLEEVQGLSSPRSPFGTCLCLSACSNPAWELRVAGSGLAPWACQRLLLRGMRAGSRSSLAVLSWGGGPAGPPWQGHRGGRASAASLLLHATLAAAVLPSSAGAVAIPHLCLASGGSPACPSLARAVRERGSQLPTLGGTLIVGTRPMARIAIPLHRSSCRVPGPGPWCVRDGQAPLAGTDQAPGACLGRPASSMSSRAFGSSCSEGLFCHAPPAGSRVLSRGPWCCRACAASPGAAGGDFM